MREKKHLEMGELCNHEMNEYRSKSLQTPFFTQETLACGVAAPSSEQFLLNKMKCSGCAASRDSEGPRAQSPVINLRTFIVCSSEGSFGTSYVWAERETEEKKDETACKKKSTNMQVEE